ncbi:MAG: hypothetical protein JEY71_03865 [Sphaerochaeta sp.]|nr:hypothetical protein [Sphaerochaeta sp.]
MKNLTWRLQSCRRRRYERNEDDPVGYGEALVELGDTNKDVVVLDADLSHATMTCYFADKYPKRFFNVGVAETNLIDISAGMSTMGYIPFCSTFALFGTGRAYEQIRNSVVYPGFNVKICCTHAGLTVGEDGGSHQAIEDIALMRVIPGMTIVVPCDANERYQYPRASPGPRRRCLLFRPKGRGISPCFPATRSVMEACFRYSRFVGE